jgi:large subunit ribosomal protein L10
MEKTKKYAEVAVLKETFSSATSAIVIEFKGLVVDKDTAFRKSVRESRAQYRVSKNTLLRLAVKDTSFEALGGSFKGSSAIATTSADVIALAKAVNGFLKDNPAATFKAGVMDGKLIRRQAASGPCGPAQPRSAHRQAALPHAVPHLRSGGRPRWHPQTEGRRVAPQPRIQNPISNFRRPSWLSLPISSSLKSKP